MQQRTKGIRCQSFTGDKSALFSIFDLGGHGEFLATHQTFIGDGSVPVIDCVVISALDIVLEKNALKWCSLFASRNQPISTPWPLLLIATRADTATEEQRRQFSTFLPPSRTCLLTTFSFPLNEPLFLDARKSWGEMTITLRRTLSELHAQLTSHGESQREPAICQRITDLLPALRKETAGPVVTKERFIEFMAPHIGLKDEEQSDVALSMPSLTSLFDKALQFLTGYATVLSFTQPQVHDLVVIDPPWLLSDIVGRLMAEPPLPGPYICYDNGYATKADVVSSLTTEHLPGETTFGMVAGLGFCLEQKRLEKVLNPSKLRNARASEHWLSDPTMVVNAGRRLKCKGTVAIASAFFPHLQVHFYHRYLTEYNEKLPLWKGGIRLVAGGHTRAQVEALIEADPASLSIDIIVRGRSGSKHACTDLLDDLTNETLRKAVEISPGSQLDVFYLSRQELDRLSPTGLVSRPRVEYSQERIKCAFKYESYITDGNASVPEDPLGLLLPLHLQEQFSEADNPPASAEAFTGKISDEDWRVVLLNLAKKINEFDECCALAAGLAVSDRDEDFVEQLRQVNPYRRPPEIANAVFDQWIRRAGGQSTEWRRDALRRVFREELRRLRLCTLLDNELRKASPGVQARQA